MALIIVVNRMGEIAVCSHKESYKLSAQIPSHCAMSGQCGGLAD